jgi:hypothetical protein
MEAGSVPAPHQAGWPIFEEMLAKVTIPPPERPVTQTELEQHHLPIDLWL